MRRRPSTRINRAGSTGRPVTLRDARRYAALSFAKRGKVEVGYYSSGAVSGGRVVLPFPELKGGLIRGAEAIAALDRLISRYGPDAVAPTDLGRERGESRPKETAEVAPQSDDPSEDSEVHGGDGNSGEVDNPALTGADEDGGANPSSAQQGDINSGSGERSAAVASESNNGAEAGDQDGSPAEERGEEAANTSQPHQGGQAGNDASDSGAPGVAQGADASQPDPNRGLGTAEDAEPVEKAPGKAASRGLKNPGSSSESDASETPQRDAEGGAMDAEGAEDEPGGATQSPEETDSAVTSSRATSQNSRTARAVWGGQHHSEGVAQRLARSAESRRAAKEVKRVLERLIEAAEQGGLEPSPRISGRKLAREIVSRRYGLARTRRDELTQQLVVLLCDVSGSCSAVADETLAACFAIAEELDHVRVILHSNGFTCDEVRWELPIKQVIGEIGQPVGLVVAFGDWDAGDEYQALCESGAKLVWLDSYCAYKGVEPVTRGWGSTAHWSKQPLAAYQGVNSATRAAIALRAAVKVARSTRG